MKKWKILLVTGLLLCFAAGSYAEVRISAAMCPFKPWGWVTDDGQLLGMEYDLYKALEKKTGYVFDISLMPMQRKFDMLTAGTLDLGDIYTFDFLKPHVDYFFYMGGAQKVLVGPHGKVLTVKDIPNLKKLGVVKGEEHSVHEYFYKNYKSNAELELVVDYGQLIQMTNQGRLDGFFIPAIAINMNFKAQGMKEVNTDKYLVIADEREFLQFSKHSRNYKPEIIAKLKKAAEELKAEGFFEKNEAKYKKIMEDMKK